MAVDNIQIFMSAPDQKREAELEALSWRVIRLSAEEAFHDDLLWARVTEMLGF